MFGKLLDYRNPDVVGDIKYLWEPNRHLHLVTLAQGYALSGKKAYFDTIAEHLDSWFLACPYGYGPNWSSALEAGLRLINWSATWQLLGPEILEKESGLPRPLAGLDLPARAVHPRLVLAAFVGQQPPHRRGRGPVHRGAHLAVLAGGEGLARDRESDPRARGAGAERARRREPRAGGRLPAVRARLPAAVPARRQGQRPVVLRRLRVAPRIDARLPGLDHGRRRQRADVRRRRRRLRGAPRAAGGLLPVQVAARHRRAALPPRRLPAEGAHARRQDALAVRRRGRRRVRRARRAARRACRSGKPSPRAATSSSAATSTRPREIRVVADAGPLGYRSIAAHGHADALSFSLSAAGLEFLIDPGTYAYHTQERWRNYFRGTSAHNTVRLDGARPVGAGRQLHVAVARRAPAAACGCPRRRRTASRAGTTATCASTTR